MNARNAFTLIVLAGTTALAAAQQPTILYLPGKSVKDQNIGLRSWGSGTIRETTEAAYEGTTSISVSSRNSFQGGIMMYGTPVDLSGQYANKDNLLRITFRIADASQVFGPGGGNGPVGPSGPGGPGGGGRPGNGRFGGGPPGPGGPVGPGGAGATTPPKETLKNLRLIVTTTDGKKSEVFVPVSTSMAGERDWRMVSIPLQAIRGLDATNKTVKELAISADATTTLYLGDLRVVSDSTKISGEITTKGPINLALGDELTLSAYGFGGSSPLKYQWDFNATDGIQVDSEGQTIKHKFRKAGHFTVTLTVVDTYGLKAPATSKLEVTINP